ncbi:sensor histidine kinase [Nitrospira japonica]|nr:ATP-binding protein [Nitrospira japonica]
MNDFQKQTGPPTWPSTEPSEAAEQGMRADVPLRPMGMAPAVLEPERRTRHFFRPVRVVFLLLVSCLALTFYYTQVVVPGGEDSDSFIPTTSYALVLLLINLDLIGVVVLLLLLSRNLIKAYFERRHRLIGSGFRTKLVAAFIGFSLIPTVLLALVASGLVNKAVDVWFSDQIDRVMRDSYEVARMQHAGHITLAVNSARAISHEIFREDLLLPAQRDILISAMARKRVEFGVAGIEVYSAKMETLTRSLDPDVPAGVLDLPVGQLVLQAINGKQENNTVQEAPTGRLVRAAAPIAASGRGGEVGGVVLVDAYVPESLLAKMDGIGRQYEEYKQIKAMKNPIKAGAYLFVAVITVLILFGATWFGFYVARSITVPIQRLAEATEAIAQGDLSVRIDAKATDEIGTLIESFNRMTTDLQSGKSAIEAANVSLRQNNLELDRRRAYIETVVATIAAGLLSIGKNGIITNFNPSGERILGISADRFHGRSANDVFKEFGLTLFQTLYDRMLVDQRDDLTMDGTAEVEGKFLTIALHGSRMKDEMNQDLGIVLVFEDLTELLKAQKVAAWQEVARRVAHEIKNPLTPIQLSAQRMRKKFFEKASDFERVFDESTNVIVNEVTSLKHMVDEFSKFARLPAPQLVQQSLHDVINEVVALYRGAHKDIELVVSLDEDLPPLKFDWEQIKRVLVNLLDNSIQAMSQKGRLWLTTQYDTKRRRAVVSIADEGSGIALEDQEKLFVPYFTRKKTGTGLGLAIVRRIITDHEGHIQAGNNHPKGAIFTFELPV